MVETRRYFEDLRQVAAQLAGLLVLEAAGAHSGVPGHPMLAAAEELYGAAAEGIRRARPTAQARRHHRYLLEAGSAIERALAAARQSLEIDPILTPLRVAYGHLQGAGSELPGFDMVSFEHGCCAGSSR